jgi:hypothetical protein
VEAIEATVSRAELKRPAGTCTDGNRKRSADGEE